MGKASEYLKTEIKTKKQKENEWIYRIKRRIEWFAREYDRIRNCDKIPDIDKKKICDDILIASGLETDGGKCPKCSKMWKKIEFENVFAAGSYHEPDCQCLMKCPRCKNHLYDYYVTTRLRMSKYVCPFCKWSLKPMVRELNEETNRTEEKILDRYGVKYEYWYDKQYNKPKNIRMEG